MPIREIVRLGDPRLRQRCAPVADIGSERVAGIIADLAETLEHWRATTGYGRAIAAPQIGHLDRVIFLNVDRRTPWPMINPDVVAASDQMITVWDGCLSFLSVFCQVPRHEWVEVSYHDPSGERHLVRADGDLSELLQHEIDHLDGILTLDRMTDVRTLVSREEFERRHREGSPYR